MGAWVQVKWKMKSRYSMDWNLQTLHWAVPPVVNSGEITDTESILSDLTSSDSEDDNAAQAEIAHLNRQLELLIADYVAVVRMYLELCRDHNIGPFAAGAGNTLDRAE